MRTRRLIAATRCDFSVARAGGGYATVVVRHPAGGHPRMIYFRAGRPIGVGSSEADACGPFSARKEQDLHRVRCGEERYEIPDAVPLGG